eukprot:CAMPEP_0173454510 /NCGR_PEP_ID=MMETSP1357-20121228/52570_1 /TAXON_ID=77926 /ORGANISM="Hemiselmis rufescens, Strain PCC563" /LENGTH=61 /DNA_ID=CAMNT_0014421541 /DNA_START=34 /DNA_END=215 /DNA_ORIENTATION=+
MPQDHKVSDSERRKQTTAALHSAASTRVTSRGVRSSILILNSSPAATGTCPAVPSRDLSPP